MTDPAGALAARIERFEQAADPELIWDPAALVEAEQAMRACAGDRSDAAAWRLIGILHLARYRLDQRTTQDAAVAGAFFAAVAVVDPGRLPEKLRGSNVPPGDSAGTWAGLVEEVFRHVDPAAYRHVGLLIHALVRRAVAHPTVDAADRLGQLLLQQAMRSADPSWAPGALALLGGGLARLHAQTGERELLDDAVHVLFRAALGAPGEAAYLGELAAALTLAAPGDEGLVRAYLAAAESAPGTRDRSQALLALVGLAKARAAGSCLDDDLLAFIRVGQCALDFWHERWAHPGVLAPYAAGLVEWYVVTGDERSLEAGQEMLEALGVAPDETARRLGSDPLARLALLADRRWRRYGVTGDESDLEAAIDTMRDAAGLAPHGHPERARLLVTLANALLRRAVVTGADPAEPITTARAALAAHAAQEPDRPQTLLLLAQALNLHLTPETADEAITALREAVAAGDRLTLQEEAYGLLSQLLRWRGVTGSGGERRVEDLNDAVLAARHGLEPAVKSSHDQAPAQRLLSEALLARFSALGDARDLGEALALARDGDADQLARLSTVLDGPGPLPMDDQLAYAATELALLSSDEDVAIKLLRFAERQFEAAGEQSETAGERGRAAGERGDFLLGTALRLAELGRLHIAGTVLAGASVAFDEAGRRSQAAYALSRQGVNHDELGEPDQALEAFERSAAIYRSLGDNRSEAHQLGSMGDVLLRAGDPARAVEQHLQAAARCAAAGLTAEEAAHQVQAADAYLAAGDPGAAVACVARARELYLTLGQREAAATVLIPAARAAVDEGDLTAAVERIAACAIELEAAGAWEDACRALDAHAVLLAGRGHRRQAAACEARMVEIVRRRGQRREPADEWYRIAQRRRADGDAAGGRAGFELAEREYESLGYHDGSASARYNLGVLAYTEGDAERALEEFGAAGERFARLRAPAQEAAALTMRASCLARLDRLEDALSELERARELAAAEGDLDALFTATLHRAVLDVRLGELQEAEDRLYAALGLAAADPLKEGVVRDRLAGLAARTGDLRAQVEALEPAVVNFRAAAQDRLAAIASIKLGFALEERGEYRRARVALEEGLTGVATEPGTQDTQATGAGTQSATRQKTAAEGPASLVARAGRGERAAGVEAETHPRIRPAEAPFEVIVAMAAAPGGLDADVLVRVAAIQLTLGDLTRGRATLAEAVTALRTGGEQPEAMERIQGWLRLEEAEASGDLRLARAAAEQALAEQAPANGTSLSAAPARERSHLLAKLSALCLALGDPSAAYNHAAHGYELRDYRIVEHLRNLGTAARALGRADEAIGHLTRAVELARETGSALPVQLVHALTSLALTLTGEARWPEAARAYDEGLMLAAAPLWRALRAPLLAGRAGLHLKLGELDEAVATYRAAISISEELGGHREDLGSDYADLGLAHLLRGENDQARPYAERALDLDRAHGNERGAVLDLILLSRLEDPPQEAAHRKERAQAPAYGEGRAQAPAYGEGRAQAAAYLEEALALAGRIGFSAGEAIALGDLGALDVATAEHARAHRRLSRAIDLLEKLGHEPALAIACHDRSGAREKLGDLPSALADAERAFELGRAPALDRAIRLAVRLGRGMTAWTHAEQAKARTLIAQLGHGRWPPPTGVPAELLESEQRGLDDVHALVSAAGRTRDPVQAAALIRRARATQANVEALWDRMEPLAADYVAMRRGTPPGKPELDALVTPAAGTSEGVGVGEVIGLLGFHVGDDTVTVLAHRTGWPEPRAFPTTVGRDLLAGFARTIDGDRPELLDIAARRHRRDLWRRLADQLLTDALQALGDDPDLLYLLPHRALHHVPLHALAPGGRLVLERCPVVYAPSAAVLTRLTRRPPARPGRSLVLGHASDAPGAAEDLAGEVATLLGADPAGPPAGDDGAALGRALLHAGARSVLLTLWPVSAEITRVLVRDFHTRVRAGAGKAQALREAVLELRELYGSAEPDLWAPYVLAGLPD
ncbi:CHAT domain-containing protein [Nonomuraea basaltis]|uniref:CHAT domain-containing protein n=1 Tax=Nonomuraea basaltis TaxID=2495887 RepID=UPI00110C4745|nr:CHAT domain-containing protein [Nonomuraea basaltis]TMR96142.1 CHAT domain-containing protein [Nonomuraea basaltis]